MIVPNYNTRIMDANIDFPLQAFERGKYSIATELFDKILRHQKQTGRSVNEIILLENDATVCAVLWERMKKQNISTEFELEKEHKTFQSLIRRIRGLPLSVHLITKEVLLQHNLIIATGIKGFHLCRQFEDSVCETLVRVLEWLLETKNFPFHKEKDLLTLLKLFFQAGTKVQEKCLENHALICAVIDMLCVWCIVLTQFEENDKAIGLLDMSSKLLSICNENDQDKRFLRMPIAILLEANLRCDKEISRNSLVNFLLAIALLNCHGDYDKEIEQCLRQVKDETLQPYSMYLSAVIEYDKGNLVESLIKLNPQSDQMCTNLKLKSMRCCLMGKCLSKLDKPHLAIEKYKESLEISFDNLEPLYHISLAYHALGLIDAELESLNLIITALNMDKKSLENSDEYLKVVLQKSSQQLSLSQALYLLAKKCLSLQKFEPAAQRYQDLIKHLDEPFLNMMSGRPDVQLPSKLVIFKECATAFHRNQSYELCLELCNRALSYDLTSNHNLSELSYGESQMNDMPDKQSVTMKRKREFSSDNDNLENCFKKPEDLNLFFIVHKADAQIQLGLQEEAEISLAKLLDLVSKDSSTGITPLKSSQNSSQMTKRQRIDSDGRSECTVQNISSDSKVLTATTYNNMACYLCSNKKFSDALKFLKLGLQLIPEQELFIYNQCLMLWRMGKQQEAVTRWMKFRKIPGSDSFHLFNLAKNKRDKLRQMKGQMKSSIDDLQLHCGLDIQQIPSESLLSMDILCIDLTSGKH